MCLFWVRHKRGQNPPALNEVCTSFIAGCGIWAAVLICLWVVWPEVIGELNDGERAFLFLGGIAVFSACFKTVQWAINAEAPGPGPNPDD